MAGYSLRLKRSAAKEIERIEPATIRRRIVSTIRGLAALPRPHGCEKLAGEENLYRVRQGDYRMVYEIEDAERSIVVIRVAHRREVYR